jgi:hypothetical protein
MIKLGGLGHYYSSVTDRPNVNSLSRQLFSSATDFRNEEMWRHILVEAGPLNGGLRVRLDEMGLPQLTNISSSGRSTYTRAQLIQALVKAYNPNYPPEKLLQVLAKLGH